MFFHLLPSQTEVEAKRAEHKRQLTVIYQNAIDNADPCGFIHNLFSEALEKLDNGADPKRVEEWVGKIERLWIKF